MSPNILGHRQTEDRQHVGREMSTKDEILAFLGELFHQGEQVEQLLSLVGPHSTEYEDGIAHKKLHEWSARLSTLEPILGEAIKPWRFSLRPEKRLDEDLDIVRAKLGAVKAIKEAVAIGLLVKIEDRVLAEAMDDLLEQADHLLEKKYSLAAGVLGRAVLEEHLRKGCSRKGCVPMVPKPTISDYNQALYKAGHLDKLAMKKADTLATAGNHCAHNADPPLTPQQVETLLRDVREFVTQHTC